MVFGLPDKGPLDQVGARVVTVYAGCVDIAGIRDHGLVRCRSGWRVCADAESRPGWLSGGF